MRLLNVLFSAQFINKPKKLYIKGHPYYMIHIINILIKYKGMGTTNQKKTQKVSFLVAGVQKGGTTALDSYLRYHPEICMANKKEVHFFDNDNNFQNNRDKSKYDLYHESFNSNFENLLLGESTPIYSYWKPAIQRIYNYNKKMKFIILLRNPIERAYSHWYKETKNFYSQQRKSDKPMETLTFNQAIHQENERLQSIQPLQHRYYSYIDRGLYYKQIKFLLNFFPMEQLLILKSNWLRYNKTHTLATVFDFLDIKNNITIKTLKPQIYTPNKNMYLTSPVDDRQKNPTNTGNYKIKITQTEKTFLLEKFESDINNLAILLNWNCKDWLE